MCDLAYKYGFQLYIVLGPEWDEGYSDPARQAKLNVCKEYLDQFTGDNMYIVLSNPGIYKAEEMQNTKNIRAEAAAYFTEALLIDIKGINGTND